MRRWRGGAAVGVFTLADTKVGLGVKKIQGAVVALGHFHTTKIRTSCRISYMVAIFLILRGKVRVYFSRYCRKKSNRHLVKPNISPTFALSSLHTTSKPILETVPRKREEISLFIVT